MKKAILLSLLFVACAFTASAQKFALIDMEYILKNILHTNRQITN